MKTSFLYLTVLASVCLLLNVISVNAQDNIPWLSNYTSEITVGSNTCSYSFKTTDNNLCKISIDEKKTDKKGVSTTMTYQFYLSDLNTSGMNFKTSGTVAVVNLAIKQSQKFIRIFKNGGLQGYDSDIAINLSEIEKARSFIEVMKTNVENCKSTEHSWTSHDEAMKWMIQNIGKSETSGIIYNQNFKPGEKSYLVTLESNSIDSKGVAQNLSFDFNLFDINPAKINMTVSGKTFKIELPTRENNYYIRQKKGADEFSFVKEIVIFSDDLEQARNILNGIVFLVNDTQAPKYKPLANYSAALSYAKENIGDVKIGTSVLGQSFNFDASPSGMANFTTKKTDSKNQTIQTDQLFYLTDLQPTVTIEISSKSITVNLLTKDKLKYIQESSGLTLLPYSSSIEIAQTDLDKARELAKAFEFAIEKSEKGTIDFSGSDKAMNWITNNVGEVRIDAVKMSQTCSFNPANENKIDYKCITTSENGTAVTESYEIYPEDLKLENCKMKVNGKKLEVELSTGKFKYIKNYKDNVLQSYISDTEVAFDNLLKAKNFILAIMLLREKSQVADRSMKDKNAALNYIVSQVKKIEGTGETFDQKMEQRDNDICKGKYTRTETNSKGVSTENIYEFIMSDIDPTASSINVSSKSLTVSLFTKNKEKLFKPYKNGEAQNFISGIEIDAYDVLEAKKLLGAFNSLSSLCK